MTVFAPETTHDWLTRCGMFPGWGWPLDVASLPQDEDEQDGLTLFYST